MIGKNQIEIKGQDFIAGISTSPDTTDGGYSPETQNVSIANVVGCISSTYASSATALSDNIICACDNGGNPTVEKFLLGNNGHLYYQAAGVYTSYATYTGNTGNLYSDMVSFMGDIYFTTDSNICFSQNSGATSGTVNSTWWTGTKGQTALTTGRRHHLFVFNGLMFITDGAWIHSWDGTSIVYKRFSLNIDQEIIDLGGDIAQGRMLVSYVQNVNYSGQTQIFLQNRTALYFVGSWDTSDPLKFVYPAVQVEDVVWTFIYYGGYQYVIYGGNFGYFTGSGIQFLRDLNFDQTIALQVINKHKVAISGNTLYMADLNQILAYGNITKAAKSFWYLFTEVGLSGTNGNILCLFKATPSSLGLGFDDSGFSVKTFDLTPTNASTQGTFYSLQYYFPNPVFIRDIDVEYKNSVNGNTTAGLITTIDETNNQVSIPIKNTNNSAAVYKIKANNALVGKVSRLQIKYLFSTGVPVRRFIIRYDTEGTM